jgi:hypothetical protein
MFVLKDLSPRHGIVLLRHGTTNSIIIYEAIHLYALYFEFMPTTAPNHNPQAIRI